MRLVHQGVGPNPACRVCGLDRAGAMIDTGRDDGRGFVELCVRCVAEMVKLTGDTVARSEYDSVVAQLNEANAAANAIKGEHGDVCAEVVKLRPQIARLQGRLDERVAEINGHKANVAALVAELEQYRRGIVPVADMQAGFAAELEEVPAA